MQNWQLVTNKKIRYKKIVDSISDIENKINDICNKAKLNVKDLYEILEINEGNIIEKLQNLVLQYKAFSDININDIDISKINKKAYSQIDSIKFKEDLYAYIELIKQCLAKTGFDEKFNIFNYKNLIAELKKTNYLSKERGRGIIFNHTTYFDIKEFENVIKKEVSRIKSDEEIIKKSSSFFNSLGDSNEARQMQINILGNIDYINAIKSGRKNILLNFLAKQGFDHRKVNETLNEINKEYLDLVSEVNTTVNEFEKAKDIFEERFNPIFDIEIRNLECSLNGVSLPTIVFKHKTNNKRNLNEKEIKDILSSGEKTTLRIIGFIAEYLTKKDQDIIIVMDDVVETFDYSNRYAFIEYIKEITNENKCIINLTHNYDFYNTIKHKIKQLDNLSVCRKQNNRSIIEVYNPKHINIESVVNTNNINNFISSIPFVREANTILKKDTYNLTKCLHYMKETKFLKFEDIIVEFPIRNEIEYKKELYFEKLIENARVLSKTKFDTYDIKKKTILSIACRLLIEEKIIKEDFTKIANINENQTNALKEKYKGSLNEEFVKLLDKVLLSTADYIHVNAFMYEPLIDIDGEYLRKLFIEIDGFNDEDIWK